MKPIETEICEVEQEHEHSPRSKEEDNPQIPKLVSNYLTQVSTNDF